MVRAEPTPVADGAAKDAYDKTLTTREASCDLCREQREVGRYCALLLGPQLRCEGLMGQRGQQSNS